MAYTLSEPFRHREFSNWANVLNNMSLDEFNDFRDYLGFPFTVSDSVRQVGRDFLVAYLRIGYPNGVISIHPFEPEVDLLQGIPQELSVNEKQRRIFSTTFSRLEELGCATEIHNWGNSTHLSYPPKYVNALFFWYLKLRDWLIVELKDTSVANRFASDAVNRLMSQEFVSRIREARDELYLPEQTKTQLQSIILNCEDQYAELTTLANRLRTSTNPWTSLPAVKYATVAWLNNEGHFRLRLEAWRKIKKILSAKEMAILEEWVEQFRISDKYGHLIIPMPDF